MNEELPWQKIFLQTIQGKLRGYSAPNDNRSRPHHDSRDSRTPTTTEETLTIHHDNTASKVDELNFKSLFELLI